MNFIKARYRVRKSRVWAQAICLLAVFLAGWSIPARPAQDQADLKPILESYRKDLLSAHKKLDSMESRLEADNAKLRDRLKFLNKKRDQLVLISGTAQDPWDFRDVLQGTAWLRRQVKTLLESPLATDKTLKNAMEQLQEIESRITGRLQESASSQGGEDLQVLREEIAGLMDHVKASQAKLRQGLTPAMDMKKSLDAWQDKISQELRDTWLQYYGEATPTLISQDLGTIFQAEMAQWEDRYSFIGQILAEEGLIEDWPVSTARSFILALALGLGAWLILKGQALKAAPSLAKIQLLGALGCWSFTLAIFLHENQLNYLAHSLTLALGEIPFGAGLVFFSRFLTLLVEGQAAPKTTTRWPLWSVFSLGLIVECSRAPDIVAQVVMAVGLLGYGWWIKRRTSKAESRLDRIMSAGCGIILPALAVASLCGHVRLGVLGATVLFYLVLSVRLSTALADLLAAWQAKAEDQGSPALRGLLSGIGLPLIFLCVATLNLWLALSPLQGQYAIMDILSLEVKFEGLSFSAKRLCLMLFGFYLIRTAIRVSKSFLLLYAKRHSDLEGGTVNSLCTISSYAWWGLFTIYVMFLLGFSFTSLAVVAGGLSVGIGFGLQQIVNNFISGLILLFGRSVEMGDVLQMGDTLGVVRKVNIRNTMVQTYDNATIFVPNSNLITNQIINWSHRDRRVRRKVEVGVAYGSDRLKVCKLLVEAALSVPEVLRDPAPDVLFTDFGQSALIFTLRVWAPEVDTAINVLSDVRHAVEACLRENAVEIAYPQTDVHLRTAPGLDDLAKGLAWAKVADKVGLQPAQEVKPKS